MSLRFTKISKQGQVFTRLVGLTVEEFKEILKEVEPLWKKKVILAYKRPGRFFKLDLSDMLMMLLIYYRSYISHVFLGHLFGLDDSRVCRIFKKLEPLIAKTVAIRKDRHLSKEELETLLIDATEQTIERPKKNQKPYYSGKKKRHTLKTEVHTTLNGRIVNVSKSYPGSFHDFSVYKKGRPVHKDTRIFVDSGYQGINKLHKKIELPYKKTKNKDEKLYNRILSSIRVKIENVLAQLKQFRILSDRYRNKKRGYNLKFNIIAGFVNFKNGFKMR